MQATVFNGTIAELLKKQEELKETDCTEALFFGCSPEVSDILHHLLFDAKGG